MKTALVTGASRGVGRGIALALASQGWRVIATGRSIADAPLPAAIERRTCDHSDPAAVDALFAALENPLDLLVNSAWGGYERMVENGQFTWGAPFWQQPLHRWTGMIDAGLRAAYLTSAHAARGMVQQKSGLIVNISFWAAQKFIGNTIYGVAKAGTDKLTADIAHELRPHGVAAISLYPSLVRTEAVMEAAPWLDLSNSESPEFIGLVIHALHRDPQLLARSGQVCIAAALAREYGVTDLDGSQPTPLTIQQR